MSDLKQTAKTDGRTLKPNKNSIANIACLLITGRELHLNLEKYRFRHLQICLLFRTLFEPKTNDEKDFIRIRFLFTFHLFLFGLICSIIRQYLFYGS